MSEEHDDAVTESHDGETTGEALAAVRVIARDLRAHEITADMHEGDRIDPASVRAILDEAADRIYGAADRIEAAAEREKAKGMSKKMDENRAITGNAAAIREALEEIVANIETRASAFDIFSIIDRKTFLDAKAALAAPARNCDRFGGDEDKLIEACLNERGLLVTENFRDVFSDWLLAPAKGGAV